ncbi:MAG: radical SAM protein [Planctomycetes bacterium]|nr:radical SAM protein [Planctomycetota bacterium]MBI3843844.1 radical SAM protein [Planctomycetota bacterium]
MSQNGQIGTLVRSLLAYRARRTRAVPPPFRLWIEPTSRCNLGCIMCPTGMGELPKGGYMDLDLFSKIVDEIRPFAHNVNLHHRGESLLHAKLAEMIRIAREAGLRTNLHSNGTLFDEKKSRALVESGLDLLSFSFDGPDPVEYERVRVRASFTETRDRIREFLRVRAAMRSAKPFTIVESIDFSPGGRDRRAKRTQLVQLFRECPPDRIRVKRPHNWAGDWDPKESATTTRSAPFMPCPFLWYSLTILWDGTVMPCPQDMAGRLALGTVQQGGVLGAWNGEKLVSLREKMAREDVSDVEPCSSCDRIRRTQVLGVPRDELRQFFLENLLRR